MCYVYSFNSILSLSNEVTQFVNCVLRNSRCFSLPPHFVPATAGTGHYRLNLRYHILSIYSADTCSRWRGGREIVPPPLASALPLELVRHGMHTDLDVLWLNLHTLSIYLRHILLLSEFVRCRAAEDARSPF